MPEASQEKTRADGAVPLPNGRPQRLSPQYENSAGPNLKTLGHVAYRFPTDLDTDLHTYSLTSLDQRKAYLSSLVQPSLQTEFYLL